MVKEYMRATMEYGTGTPANIPRYEIRAKKGTAEKTSPGKWKLSAIPISDMHHRKIRR